MGDVSKCAQYWGKAEGKFYDYYLKKPPSLESRLRLVKSRDSTEFLI